MAQTSSGPVHRLGRFNLRAAVLRAVRSAHPGPGSVGPAAQERIGLLPRNFLYRRLISAGVSAQQPGFSPSWNSNGERSKQTIVPLIAAWPGLVRPS